MRVVKKNATTKYKRNKPKFDAVRIKVLTDCLAAGAPIGFACKSAGIPERTYRDWLAKAANGDSDYFEVVEQIKKAEGDFVTSNVVIVQLAAKKTWQAAAWLLERRFPENFSTRREITGPGGKPIEIALTGREKLKKMMDDRSAALAKAAASDAAKAAQKK